VQPAIATQGWCEKPPLVRCLAPNTSASQALNTPAYQHGFKHRSPAILAQSNKTAIKFTWRSPRWHETALVQQSAALQLADLILGHQNCGQAINGSSKSQTRTADKSSLGHRKTMGESSAGHQNGGQIIVGHQKVMQKSLLDHKRPELVTVGSSESPGGTITGPSGVMNKPTLGHQRGAGESLVGHHEIMAKPSSGHQKPWGGNLGGSSKP